MTIGPEMHWTVITQTAIGTVLVTAALAKVVGRRSVRLFLDALAIPPVMGALVARVVPAAEGLCGALLILQVGAVPVLLVAAALTSGFAVTLLVAYRSGVTTGCRCFGVLDSGLLTPIAIVRAAILASASVVLLASYLGSKVDSNQLWRDQFTAVTVSLGALAGFVYVMSFAILDQVYEFERGRAIILAYLRSAKVATVEEMSQ